jgi:hypothetical protein
MDVVVAMTYIWDLEERLLVGMGIIFHWQITVPFSFKVMLFNI